MIGRLVGQVVQEEVTGGLVLDVHGVGYELACPVGTVGRAQVIETEGQRSVVLHVHTNLRQDHLELFGFSSALERETFRKLTTVPNVGPRLALAVLNVLPAEELSQVIDSEDKARLGKVPGVGKKTAERLVLELRGKLPRGAGPGIAAPEGASSASSDRLVAALTGLGYRASEAEKAARQVTTSSQSQDLSVQLREALKVLAP